MSTTLRRFAAGQARPAAPGDSIQALPAAARRRVARWVADLAVRAAKGAVHLIAGLSRVDFLDSAGPGALVGGLKRLREAGGSLALMISTPRILRIFQITGLTKALAARRSATDAITADPH